MSEICDCEKCTAAQRAELSGLRERLAAAPVVVEFFPNPHSTDQFEIGAARGETAGLDMADFRYVSPKKKLTNNGRAPVHVIISGQDIIVGPGETIVFKPGVEATLKFVGGNARLTIMEDNP